VRTLVKSTLAAVTAIAAVGLGVGTASASAASATAPQVHKSTAAHVAPASAAKPLNLACAYGHFCGQDSHGGRIDLYRCVKVPIGLSGPGEYFNNQTPGTWAVWYDSAGNELGGAEDGVDTYIDWTRIWYVKPC
jgi:hypothetical protein